MRGCVCVRAATLHGEAEGSKVGVGLFEILDPNHDVIKSKRHGTGIPKY
jgi:hypothetical protein